MLGYTERRLKIPGMNIPSASALSDQSERLVLWPSLMKLAMFFCPEYKSHATVSRDRVALWEAIGTYRETACIIG